MWIELQSCSLKSMSSPASVATLGSSRPSASVAGLDICSRIHVVSRVSFSSSRSWSHGSGRICRCMSVTGLVEEKGAPISAESTSTNSKDDNPENVLKPAPKPVLKSRPNTPANGVNFAPRVVREERVEKDYVEDREKVIESLGEVLEKAEKLEISGPNKISGNGKVNGSVKPSSRPVNSNPTARKSKTLKSVWRKGNPVVNVERVTKEVPRVDKEKEEENKVSVVSETKKADGVTPLRPNMPSPPNPAPKLQTKPSVASPPTVKNRKPILIDKFASKKPIVDTIAAEAILTPTKPIKTQPSKVKDERRKKTSAAGGRRRLVDDTGIAEDASELGVPIPGVTEARKGRKWSKASRKAARLEAAKAAAPVKVEILEVVEDGMSSEDLAFNLAVSEAEILGYLFSKGIKPDTVQKLDKDLVKMICKEHDVEVIDAGPVRIEEMAKKKEVLDDEDLDMLEERPPVITIMGHVDHGKTTLLDYIRKSKVVASEAGGITQGMGAYTVEVPIDGKLHPCVFLDTPGHEAFGAMRARGARVTDITIIVVAADDGVRPQTNEAIAHAKAAGVPIVIAINKIDKDGANPDRVMQELSSVGLMPEVWGGDIPMVPISALKGKNIDELLETVMLVAELQELKANPHRNAKGTVIEAGLDKAKGPVVTLIVQNGTLKKGDVVVCGEAFGKVRAMFNDRGGRVDKAGPSMAVQILGFSDVPIAGDEFEVVDNLDIARERANARADTLRVERISAKAGEGKVTLASIASTVSAGRRAGLDMHQLNLILKVDVQGSIEAIRHAIQVLPRDNVSLKFLLQAPGDVSTSDIDLAAAAEAVILGFNVKAPGSVKSYAEKKNIEVRLYRVIYDLIDDLRNAMEGLLDPVEEQISIGTAEVRATFSSGSGRVAGCMVVEGKVVKDCGFRVIRKGKKIHTGTIDSLRRVKEEVKEVGASLECGIGADDFSEWEVGDVIEAFNTVTKKRTLEEASASVTAALAEAGVDV